MNVHLLNDSQLTSCGVLDGMPGDNNLVIGLNPPTDLSFLDAFYGLEAKVFRWLANVRLLLALPTSMTLLPRDQWSSQSEGSSALYPAFWETPERGSGGGILLQLLSADSDARSEVRTSEHYHERTVERFYPVHGSPEIRIGGGSWQPLTWRVQVQPFSPHQVRLKRGSAVTLIRMDGPFTVRGSNCMDDHFYD